MALDVLVADVSAWQSEDVSSLAGLGFKAVIPKYTEDLSSASGFKAHAQCASARAAGMTVFAGYDFALGSNGAAQCDALLEAFAGDAIQRAVLDAEVRSVGLDVVVSFGRRAREWNPNVKPILYGSTSFLQEMYGNAGEVANLYDAWVAAYTSGYDIIKWPATAPPNCPRPFGEYIGWQFTSQFPTPIGLIDASVFNSTVFATDQRDNPAHQKNGASGMVISEINPNGVIKQWWLREGARFTKIDQSDAYVMVIGGVPWVKNIHSDTLFGWMVNAAVAEHDLQKQVALVK